MRLIRQAAHPIGPNHVIVLDRRREDIQGYCRLYYEGYLDWGRTRRASGFLHSPSYRHPVKHSSLCFLPNPYSITTILRMREILDIDPACWASRGSEVPTAPLARYEDERHSTRCSTSTPLLKMYTFLVLPRSCMNAWTQHTQVHSKTWYSHAFQEIKTLSMR